MSGAPAADPGRIDTPTATLADLCRWFPAPGNDRHSSPPRRPDVSIALAATGRRRGAPPLLAAAPPLPPPLLLLSGSQARRLAAAPALRLPARRLAAAPAPRPLGAWG